MEHNHAGHVGSPESASERDYWRLPAGPRQYHGAPRSVGEAAGIAAAHSVLEELLSGKCGECLDAKQSVQRIIRGLLNIVFVCKRG